jgi:hypothetical protein
VQAIEKLAGEMSPAKLMVLEYHIRDQYATGETMAWFTNFNSSGTPAVYFNGEHPVLGGGDTSSLYNMYLSRVTAELALNSSVSMEATFSTRNNQVSVKITNKSPQEIGDAQLVGVIYVDFGMAEHHFIVRDLSSSQVNLAAGETKDYKVTLEVPGQVAVFLKSASGSILQSLSFS